MYQYLRPAAVKKLLDEHRSRAANNYKVLFSLVLFEQWLRQAYDTERTTDKQTVA
jgi:asparagine synthase (glutamine-hydrolysing)